MKLTWNFKKGVGVLRKNSFRGGGMDIFLNYTIYNIHWYKRDIDQA